jgi:hypothetical protein
MNSASTWPLRDAARAADVDSTTLRQWFGTGVLKYRSDDNRKTGTGHHIGLSKPRIYEAKIVRQLTRHGVAPSRAARGAEAFTLNGGAGRAAGHLYPLAKTVLVITATDAVVANVDPDARVSDLSNNGVAMVVDLNKIVADVDAVLNNSKH